jgi:hypothetical protein
MSAGLKNFCQGDFIVMTEFFVNQIGVIKKICCICDCEIHHSRFLSACFSSLSAVLKLFGFHLCVSLLAAEIVLP